MSADAHTATRATQPQVSLGGIARQLFMLVLLCVLTWKTLVKQRTNVVKENEDKGEEEESVSDKLKKLAQQKAMDKTDDSLAKSWEEASDA